MGWFSKSSEKELHDAYMAGFIKGQESAWRLQPELTKTFFSRARFIPERLVYEVPQESYEMAKMQLQDTTITLANQGLLPNGETR